MAATSGSVNVLSRNVSNELSALPCDVIRGAETRSKTSGSSPASFAMSSDLSQVRGRRPAASGPASLIFSRAISSAASISDSRRELSESSLVDASFAPEAFVIQGY